MSVIGIEAYPLLWPDGWKRTPHNSRKRSRFKTTFAVARGEVPDNGTNMGECDECCGTGVMP